MAIVKGSNYTKMYDNNVKENGDAGLQHVNASYLADFIAAANASDECYIGKLQQESRIIGVGDLEGTAAVYAIEDADGNAINIGDIVDPATDIIIVPAAGVTNKHLFVKYLQC